MLNLTLLVFFFLYLILSSKVLAQALITLIGEWAYNMITLRRQPLDLDLAWDVVTMISQRANDSFMLVTFFCAVLSTCTSQ